LTAGKDRVRIESAKELIIMGFFDSLAHSAGSSIGWSAGKKAEVKAEAKAQKKVAAHQAKLDQEKIDHEASLSALETVTNMRFDGSADDMANNLNTLFTLYKQEESPDQGGDAMANSLGSLSSLGGFLGKKSAKSDSSKIRDAIIEKMEFGILRLRKQDAETADFFQKKFNGLQ
jgi:hypothetical protein